MSLILLLFVEVSSEVRLVVIADITACCALRHVELQRGHAHACIFQVGNRLCVQREYIHDHLDDQLLLQHVEELGISGAAIVAIRQSRYLLPNEIVVGSALMDFWVVVDTHEYSAATYA